MKKIIKKLYDSFLFSIDGFKYAIKHDMSIRIETVLLPIAIFVLFFTSLDVLVKVIVLQSLILIYIAEVFNTAIEAIVDRISPEKHELSKAAKDLGSLAVFLATLSAFVLFIFFVFFY